MGIAAAGAGAAESLKDFLLQMLREGQLKDAEARTGEVSRHNQAAEGLTGRQIEATQGYRSELQRQNDIKEGEVKAEHQRTEANRQRDDQRAALDDLLPGVMITPDTRNKAVTSGAAAPERFKDVKAFDEDFVGPLPSEAGLPGPQRGETTAYTLEGQAKKAQGRAPELKTVMLDGKPVDANYDNNGRLIYRGQDVTEKAEHYTAPSVSFVQTGDNWGVGDRHTGKITPTDNPIATTGSTRTMKEGAQMLQPHVAELTRLAEALDKKGMFGPVMSRIRQAAEKVGTTGDDGKDAEAIDALGKAIADDPNLNQDELVGQFATTLGLMTSGMGRVHGGARGGGSIQMINYLKSLLSANSSLSMFKGRAAAMDSFLKTYAGGTGGGKTETQTTDPADDIYQQYLNRQKQPQ